MTQMKPRVRFSGFYDNWEQHKLGNHFAERVERSAEGELISVTINSGVVRAADLGRHDSSSEDKSHYKRVEVGDIAYNSMRMWQGASGYSPYSGILSPAYTVAKPQEGVDSLFFAYMFKKPELIHQFEINSQGLTKDTWNLKFPPFSEIEVKAPAYDEQVKISEYLYNLDHLFNLQQQKYHKLVNLKKSLIDKMFPKNGADVPEIRFAGFNGAWEQRKLGESIVESTERTSDFKNYPLYSLTIESGVTAKTERYERGFLVTKDSDLFKVVSPQNFVTNPMNLRFGAIGFNRNPYKISVSGYYDVFSIDSNECSEFWNAYLKTLQTLKKYDDVATGSLIEKRRVHFSELQKIAFLVPKDSEEKRKIGEYFKNLDNLITLHQREMEKLKNVKKSMLERLFV